MLFKPVDGFPGDLFHAEVRNKFTDNFLEFPKFVGKKKYDELIFEDICPHIRKVVIKNRENKKALFMEKNGEPCFKSSEKIV